MAQVGESLYFQEINTHSLRSVTTVSTKTFENFDVYFSLNSSVYIDTPAIISNYEFYKDLLHNIY
jgi:hypothetical protein